MRNRAPSRSLSKRPAPSTSNVGNARPATKGARSAVRISTFHDPETGSPPADQPACAKINCLPTALRRTS